MWRWFAPTFRMQTMQCNWFIYIMYESSDEQQLLRRVQDNNNNEWKKKRFETVNRPVTGSFFDFFFVLLVLLYVFMTNGLQFRMICCVCLHLRTMMRCYYPNIRVAYWTRPPAKKVWFNILTSFFSSLSHFTRRRRRRRRNVVFLALAAANVSFLLNMHDV